MYGRLVSGRIANKDLVAHLLEHGYTQDPNIPCLFEHATNKTIFALIVDDFGVKYTGIEHLNELIRVLRLKWPVKVDLTGKKFVGMRLEWHYDAPTPHVYLDMPTTVPDAIARFYPNGIHKGSSTPSTYIGPAMTGKPDLGATIDTSKPVSLEAKLFIQQVTGVFLYYARMIDITMLPATRAISEQQSAPTEKTLADTHQLLRYAYSHPNHRIKFEACDMVLHILSDASHLSLLISGSVAGGYHFLGNKGDPFTLNGSISAVCCRIPTVCQAASESEYASLFLNGQQGYFERAILAALHYPQEPTILYTDNETAKGIANDSCKIRRSKAMDMRYHWIRDRVRQGIFKVVYRKGADIDADFLTKPLPVYRHKHFIGRFVHPPKPPNEC
jgi:hypothetical protein